jgi:hypothetical protein
MHRCRVGSWSLGLLKVAVRVTELAARIKVALPSAFGYQDSWGRSP